MSLEEAARRRDFTINAVMYDPLADEYLDPYDGRGDIERRLIRAVDPRTFVEDSLRVLRAMQFAARFEYEIDEATIELCRAIDLSDLPSERVWAEVEKWLLQSRRPSIGLWAAWRLGITEKLWPEIHALVDCPQDPAWHPEGWSLSELPFQPRVTSMAQSESLVWAFGTSALSADEVIRIMFKVPLGYMGAMALGAIADFEIVRRIVHPVAIYVMNVLAMFKPATELQFHNDPMDRDRPVTPWPTGVHVAAAVVDARAAAIDGDVLFDFDLAVVRNGELIHDERCVTKHRFFQVTLGDVFTHTGLVIDEARQLIADLPYAKRVAVMLGALCHDFGKPLTTTFEGGRIRSRGHEEAGVALTEAFLDRLNLHTLDGYDVRRQVIALVDNHLTPAHYYKSQVKGEPVSDGAFRRLAQRVEPELLYRVARADCLGRTGDFQPEAEEWFIARARALEVTERPPEPILKGRHVLALGLEPGPRVGRIIRAVYELQLDGQVVTLEDAIAAARRIIASDLG
jgi:hypothetical protein